MDVAQFMHDERVRLNKEIDKLNQQKADLDDKIADVQRELKAIDAYERTKSGRAATASTGKRRTGIRDDVLAIIKQHPDGIARSEILKQMNAEDKSAQQSVSNALANLKRQGTVSGEDGTYKPVTTPA